MTTYAEQEKRRTLLSALTSDERSMAHAFDMDCDRITAMVADREADGDAEPFSPEDAAARLGAMDKEDQNVLFAASLPVAHRLLTCAAKAEPGKYAALRDATRDAIRASGGKVPGTVKASASAEIHRGLPTRLVRLTRDT